MHGDKGSSAARLLCDQIIVLSELNELPKTPSSCWYLTNLYNLKNKYHNIGACCEG